ncbi:probable glutamate receptor [Hylaeus volcanicus]|uniref:probable glutamate receptor n=1 Tax=Hylaeus volcanicus TaxID=313075 RepID=UPI0023B8196D|nr:probable glutamate receptor [Hylaeus volcanicus]XP_053985410.1 probable glutamate receptor [Hylaeus volcanicus]
MSRSMQDEPINRMESAIGSFLFTIRSHSERDTSYQLLGMHNLAFMRNVLLLLVIYTIPKSVRSVNGVIWEKTSQNFVPIFSVPAFAAINQELVNQSRAEEIHNFQGQVVRFTYYEMQRLITSEANGTKVAGIFGEVWNTLSNLLNFRLKPILAKERTMGTMDENGIYTFGLMRIIQRNETDVVPRIVSDLNPFKVSQFTFPLWPISYHLFIRPKLEYSPTWMLKLFSQNIWYAILFTYLLMTICSYLVQTVNSRIMSKKLPKSLGDHLLYNFGLMCEQADCLPCDSSTSMRIVDLWLGLFSFLIRAAFEALLISYMMQTTFTPPFHDLESFLNKTSYKICLLDGTVLAKMAKGHHGTVFDKLYEMNRIKEAANYGDMYRKVCSSNKWSAMHHNLGIKNSMRSYTCRMRAVGDPVYHGHIVSGISKNFSNKRSIDIGILRMKEYGILQRISNSVKGINHDANSLDTVEPIHTDQVYLILVILASGAFISVIFLVLEVLVFYYNN